MKLAGIPLPVRRICRGFTLVELLAIILIISLLVAILVPALGSAREAARRTSCANNVKQLITSLLTHASGLEAFPAGTSLLDVTPTAANNTWCRGGTNDGYTPWTVAILPRLETQELCDNFTFGFEPEGRFMQDDFTIPLPNGAAENMVSIPVFQCPSSRYHTNPLRNNYFGVQGAAPAACTNTGDELCRFYTNGVLFANSQVRLSQIRDGVSHVLVVGETAFGSHQSAGVERFNWLISGKSGSDAIPCQIAGVDLQLNASVSVVSGTPLSNFGTRGFGSDHAGGCYFAFADGAVHFLRDSVSHTILLQLAGRKDGGVIMDAIR